MEGRRQPLNCLVDYVSFSAHVDFVQNRDFITSVNPRNIILVHGAKEEMGRLKGAMMMHYNKLPENKRPTIAMPPNEVEVKLIFTRRRFAKVMGKPAEAPATAGDDGDGTAEEGKDRVVVEPRLGDDVRGILVTQQNSSKIVAPEDLSTYTPLRVGSVSSRLHVPFVGKIETLRMFLNEMFRGIDELNDTSMTDEDNDVEGEGIVTFSMHGGQVKVVAGKTKGVATVEWDCSSVGDVIADSVVALIMHAQSSAASIKLTSRPCSHRSKKLKEEGGEETDPKVTTEEYLRALHQALVDQFLSVEAIYEANKGTFEIKIDAINGNDEKEGEDDGALICTATAEFEDGLDSMAKITVESEDEKLASNVRACLQNVAAASAAIPID